MNAKIERITDDQIDRLDSVLRTLHASMRYQIVKTLDVSGFFHGSKGKKKSKPLLLGELVELGAKRAARTAAFTKESFEKLMEFVEKLCAPDRDASPPAAGEAAGRPSAKCAVFSPPLRKRSGGPEDEAVPLFGSSKVEIRIIELVQRLKASDNFHKIRNKTLGHYWRPEGPHAPFEEAMTLKQVIGLNIEALLKKRSFAGQKVNAFIQALECACAEADGVEMPAWVQTASAAEKPAAPCDFSWSSGSSAVSSCLRAALCFFEQESIRAVNCVSAAAKLFKEIPQRLSADEFLLLWLLSEHDLPTAAGILGQPPAQTEQGRRSAVRKLVELFNAVCPDVHGHWEIALAGPGIPEEKLVSPYCESQLDASIQTMLWKALLSASGAVRPVINGRSFEKYWTRNSQGAQIAFDSIVAALPLSDDELSGRIAGLFPFFEAGEIFSALKQVRSSGRQ